jgi:hypothetical protein
MVWIVGSFIIKWAFEHTGSRPVGTNLDLQCYGYSVLWVGHPGLKVVQVINLVHALLNWRRPPALLVIHAGGNYIGNMRCGLLRYNIKLIVKQLMQLLPNTTIVWSSILPRLRYRSSKNTKAMENCRTRINRSLVDYVIKYKGKAIKYPEFNDRYPGLFFYVHLSFIGNDLILNTIQGAFDTFLHNFHLSVYPLE